jgi:hypothetical protein
MEGREAVMEMKWERREGKEEARRNFRSDNRVSINLIHKISTNGEPGKRKRVKRIKY